MMTKYGSRCITQMNSVYFCQKYPQELIIYATQEKHISLTKYHYSMQILDEIFIIFYKFLFIWVS